MNTLFRRNCNILFYSWGVSKSKKWRFVFTAETIQASKVMDSASFLVASNSTVDRYLSPKLGNTACNITVQFDCCLFLFIFISKLL